MCFRNSVPYYYHIVEASRGFLEPDIDGGCAADDRFLRLVADEADCCENGYPLSRDETEYAVAIGEDLVCSTIEMDGGAHEGCAGFVDNLSG